MAVSYGSIVNNNKVNISSHGASRKNYERFLQEGEILLRARELVAIAS